MSKLRKLIILDDDNHYSGMLALDLQQHFPELMVSSFNRGEVIAGYDVYILDNDFGGEKQGAQLAEKVRSVAPSSLVIMLSATLEIGLLKRLVNCHAAGVFDKSQPNDLKKMMDLIDDFLIAQKKSKPRASKESLSHTVTSISKLISEWNKRLSYEERV